MKNLQHRYLITGLALGLLASIACTTDAIRTIQPCWPRARTQTYTALCPRRFLAQAPLSSMRLTWGPARFLTLTALTGLSPNQDFVLEPTAISTGQLLMEGLNISERSFKFRVES
jgi:hypothetical protein